MKTISQHVEDYMREYPFLSKFLRQGVINYRALARDMEPEISSRSGLKVSIESIAISLQRLHNRDKDKIYSLIGRLRGVSVISDVNAYTLPNDAPAFEFALELASKESGIDNPFILVLRGHAETTCLLEDSLAAKFKELTGAKYKASHDNLVALIVTRELLNDTEIGGLSYPLQVLAENGILVQYVAATKQEEVILIENEVADKAARILRTAMAR